MEKIVYKKIKTYIVTLIKIILAIIFVWYLFESGRITRESFVSLVKIANFPFLLLSAVFFIFSQVLSSLRLVFLLRVSEISLTLREAFKLTMIGNFFNIVIPGMVGGDIVKGYILTKNESNGRGKSSGTIIMDRLLGLFALLFIGIISVIYFLQASVFTSIPYEKELRTILLFSIVSACFFLLLLLFGKNNRIRKKLKKIAFTVFRGGFFYNMFEGFGAVTKKRRYLVYTISLSIVVQLTCLTGLLVLVNLTGDSTSKIIPLLAVSSIVMLAGVVPITPGNIGWTELIATFGWSMMGSSNGAVIFFYWRLVTLFCSLPWGFIYLYPLRHNKEGAFQGDF